jgi:hypothetical protein
VITQSAPGNGQKFEPESATMSSLLGRLFGEFTTLLRKELALFRAEMNEALATTKTAVIAMAAGGAVLFAGVMALLAAVILLLALVMPAWLAALIIGVVLMIAGVLMLLAGKRKLDPAALKPERTQEALRKDKHLVQRRV